MEGSESDSVIKIFNDASYEPSNQKRPGQNTLSNISDYSKEMECVNDSSLDCLAKELFKEDSNSNNLSSNKKKGIQFDYKEEKNSMGFDSGEEGVVLGELPECSDLVDFIDKTLTLSNQNIVQAMSVNYISLSNNLQEGFKYNCHVVTEQFSEMKSVIGKLSPFRSAAKKMSYSWFNSTLLS
jgi:hypothetical protein